MVEGQVAGLVEGGPRRIGLFGGSFDPVHEGHLHVARAARERWGLARVVFVPAAQNPFKAGRRLESGAHRLAMLSLALEGERGFETSALELARGGSSYTIDTVRALPAALGEAAEVEICLLLGSDNLESLGQWREARALLERVQPVVVARAGEHGPWLAALERQVGPELARKVEQGYLELPPVRVSSTELRGALPGAEVTPELVPARVLAYIRAHGLYGARR